MTLSTTINVKQYTGDGVTTDFSFPYLVYNTTDLTITLDNVVTTDWSLTDSDDLADSSGVTVRFDSAPASDVNIIIRRLVSYTQQTDFENFDGNPADVTEKQLDLIVMQTQQISEGQNRTITVPLGIDLSTNDISGTIDSSTRIVTISTSGPATANLVDLSTSLDTLITSEADGDFLIYDAGAWQNKTLTEIKNTLEVKLNNYSATTAPTVNEDSGDGYSVGSVWVDVNNDTLYTCLDSTVGAAVWKNNDLVNDSTPQLGGQLDVNGQSIGDGTRELITFTEDGSAVNHVNIENESTGNGPTISAAGDDTNIDLNLDGKGTGQVALSGLKYPSSDGSLNQVIKTDGSGNLSFGDDFGSWTYLTPQTITGGNGNFTGIPSGTTEIEIFVSNGTATIAGQLYLTLGDAGGIESSGYSSCFTPLGGTPVTSTSNFVACTLPSGSGVRAKIVLSKVDDAIEQWNFTANSYDAATGLNGLACGEKTVSAVLTQFTLTPSAGGFNAGNFYARYR